ncbi:MAG: hypothetical protein GXO66_07010 [Euryarchaeota archaeon]|nr:hypothetical protein [Euryarchaeota archaeon]
MNLRRAIEAVAEVRSLVVMMLGVHLFFLLFGYSAASLGLHWAMAMRQEFLSSLSGFVPLQSVAQRLESGSLIEAVAITFAYNLGWGALVGTTLTGVLLFLPALVSSFRALYAGLAFYDNITSPEHLLLVAGTVLLEFGAYSISAALGTALGIELVRRGEVRRALSRIVRGYALVVLLLLLGAVWEIAGIYILLR